MDPADPSDDAHSEQDAVAAAFLVALLRDRERGQDLPMAHYQARFEGFDEVIAREYERATGEGQVTSDDAPIPVTIPDLDDNERYRIDDEVGRGGMGVVWKAFENRLQRHLALKKVRTGASQRELARFLEEARITAQLHHPGIVPVHDLGMDEHGQLYFTMDLVRGRTFANVLAEQKPDVYHRPIEILLRVCEAVAFAHDKGIVHRDLKPQNIMVGRFGEVYVMDWGLAHYDGMPNVDGPNNGDTGDGDTEANESLVISARTAGDTPEWTMPGDIVGTPAYMAPEQASGQASADARGDIYAIGAMLYQMLARTMPYVEHGASASSHAILDRVVQGSPRPLAELAANAPAELVAICERAMARKAEQRYATVLELRDDLRAYAEGRVVGAYEHGTWAELKKWVLRNKAIAASALAAVCALAIALGVSLTQTAYASQEAKKANISFGDSMDAIEAMLSRVGQNKLQNVPQSVEIRRDLLEKAVVLYERLLSRREHDPLVRRRTASANYRVAGLYLQMGERAKASQAVGRALELRLQDLEKTPDDGDLLGSLTETYNEAGLQAQSAGDYEKANDYYDRGDQIAARLVEIRRKEAAHGSAATTRALADALNIRGVLTSNRGVVLYRQKDFARAEQILQRALADQNEVARLREDITKSNVAATRIMLGTVHRAKKDYAAARREWQTAVDILERGYAENPTDHAVSIQLGRAMQNLAISMFDQKDWSACNRTIDRAIAVRRRDTDNYPELAAGWAGLGAALTNKSQFLRRQKSYEAAIRAGHEAVASVGKALAIDPQNTSYQNSYYLAHSNAYRSANVLARHARVAELAAQLANHPLATRQWRRTGAMRLAVACRSVPSDQQIPTGERATWQARYAAQAMAVLTDMAERGELTLQDLDHKTFAAIAKADGMAALRERVKTGQ